jgi:cation-transporting ATPase F
LASSFREQVVELLDCNAQIGLTAFDVKHRLQHFGPNEVSAGRRRHPILQFLAQFHQPLVYILLAAGLITALLQEWVDSGVIMAVILVNAVVGFLQESKAEAAIESLRQIVTTEVYGAPGRAGRSGAVPGYRAGRHCSAPVRRQGAPRTCA